MPKKIRLGLTAELMSVSQVKCSQMAVDTGCQVEISPGVCVLRVYDKRWDTNFTRHRAELIPLFFWTLSFSIWKNLIWKFVWNFVVLIRLVTASLEQLVWHARLCSSAVSFRGRLIHLKSVKIAGFHPRFIWGAPDVKWFD